MSEERITGDIVVGVKQTFRMIEQRKVSVVYIAEDADSFVTKGVEQAALIRVASKRQLGMRCGIEIGAAVAGVLIR